ncbi:hypothetical protein K437DRAFT_261963 [Tilletiaria anomala UBC 951]|uniref:Uncharacterized protein n=1 Tax=Tilletiaria anomala (strain ATCC 24038 / CBS 436.72 / UBC 951) TaxID=1037660 RepID=A0A066WD16_TILAU|nr:uncharacterized protein K437DRAFT_261963 [Tilletiaria anomala UBC 951]KDN50413.1 hypothetical protein K437DRAFT_261963 [Tilletiaria anomala UBC 951]
MPRCPSVRRWASSSSSSSSGSSDSLWAISSVVFFGSLFVYLTSPSVKGHAKGHTPTPHKTETFDANDETLHDLKKTEDQSDTHLESNNFLTTAAHSPNSTEAPTQKTEDAPTTSDATTLKTGVANAKDSDHISDPQNVVAAAATEKHDKEVDRKGNDE